MDNWQTGNHVKYPIRRNQDMRNTMKRIWAMALVVMMIFSMAPGALAASEYYSGSLTVGGRVKATAAPTAAPTPALEAQEPAADAEPADSAEPVADPDASAQPAESNNFSFMQLQRKILYRTK